MKTISPLPPLWTGLWAPLLALAWLLPNHYYPWATFHSDAWVAVMLAVACAAVFLRGQVPVAWRPLTILFSLLALVPLIQFSMGLLPYMGQAWVNSLFVFGLVLALLTGAQWEAASPSRAADALFLAIGIAAIVSVGLQLRQWVAVMTDWDDMQIWMAEFSPGRPSANLGQPNQLATLLLWGMLAAAWGVVRGKIGRVGALAMVFYLLFGLALTQSRTAMLAVFVSTAAVWCWRKWLPRGTPWYITVLFGYFLICTFSLQYLSDLLHLDHEIRSASFGGGSSRLRIQAYQMFLDALAQHPWVGYGWNRLAVAHLAVAENHPSMQGLFQHSHNLFLDLALWNGIPIGGLVALILVGWMVRRLGLVRSPEEIVMALFLVVVGLHAMVELPLHHAYFLLPTGLVMGMLEQKQHARVLFRTSRWIALLLWLCCCILLFSVMRDYLRVEENFRVFRLEINRVGNLPPGHTPDVLVLDDLADFMRNARLEFDPAKVTEEEMQHLYRVVTSFPTSGNMLRYAQVLAFRRGSEETQLWLRKVEKMLPPEIADGLKAGWVATGKQYPEATSIPWPEAKLP
ncbi:Wzy polymerase domain-containing protein [Variovorax sp. HJSM1_2]|uniref:PglL family O-oligosaccharyltransferase n=1 Tax=Variovorax sp. HJSM1_2 TaxID=3366263 RepID=UPI003BBBBD0E